MFDRKKKTERERKKKRAHQRGIVKMKNKKNERGSSSKPVTFPKKINKTKRSKINKQRGGYIGNFTSNSLPPHFPL